MQWDGLPRTGAVFRELASLALQRLFGYGVSERRFKYASLPSEWSLTHIG